MIYPEVDVEKCLVIPVEFRKKISRVWQAPKISFPRALKVSVYYSPDILTMFRGRICDLVQIICWNFCLDTGSYQYIINCLKVLYISMTLADNLLAIIYIFILTRVGVL